MQLEFHQLDRRWEHLRAREPHRQRRLLASLAASGQQTPIVVIASPDHPQRYLVIDGHKRIAGAGTTGPGHGGSHGLGDARSRSPAAVAVAAVQPTGKRVGTRLAVGRDGATLRLWAGRTGAPLRPQHQLGIAPAGAGGITAGSDPTASARRQDRGAGGDEVSGAGGPRQRGRLHAHGRRFRRTPLRHAASRATLYGLAARHTHGSGAHSRRAGAVFENAAAATGSQAGGSRISRARSGDGGRHPASRRQAARRNSPGDDRGATETSAGADRNSAPGSQPAGGTNRKGAGTKTC
jgi:hypothetical protein